MVWLRAALLVAATSAARDVVNFDFAWRHSGDTSSSPRVENCTYEEGVNYGNGSIWSGTVASKEECCGKCATNDKCIAWDFDISSDPSGNGGPNCYVKDNNEIKVTNPQRVSGKLPASPAEDLPAEAKADFDDASWEVIQAPHDMLITGKHDESNSNKQAFLARGKGWYRKHFSLPAEWKGGAVWIYFEGLFHETTTWLNGKKLGYHPQGYTSFWYRIDDQEGAWDSNGELVLAIYVDASSGTGWWYEGGGLARHNYLVHTAPLHVLPDRAWAYSNVTGTITPKVAAVPAAGHVAEAATFHVQAEIADFAQFNSEATFDLKATVKDQSGATVATATKSGASAGTTDMDPIAVSSAELWSVARPYLYTITLDVISGGATVDSVTFTTGIRAVKFTAAKGFFLNEQRVKMRGFCDHSNFGGVGSAVPDRVNLFRAQTLRAVGGNAWRMAHNPPVPARLDIMDRLGMVAMDENRDFGGQHGQGGTTPEGVTQELVDMGDMVQRDRNHPSIVFWSFCNEVGCNNETAAADFRKVAYKYDGSRPVTQNHLGSGEHPVSMFSLDVQGMSHKHGDVMDTFHKNNPDKPVVSSECCSCLSQRGVDADTCPDPKDGGDDKCKDASGNGGSAGVFYNNEISECTSSQVAYSDSRDFNAGTFLWSGFDYLGESRGWPQTVKCRGAVADIAGFEKESAPWLRSWWLSNISSTDHGRPVLPAAVVQRLNGTEHTVFIVETWQAPAKANAGRTIHVYTNAPQVKLLLNGKQVGQTAAVPFFGSAAFSDVAYADGELKAVAIQDGAEVASFSRHSAGTATAVRLSIDAPSPLTGTGSKLVADGADVAMLRAELVDASGNLVANSFANLTFAVKSGGGRVLATHNGGPALQQAYHGLARVMIISTKDHATSAAHRSLMRRIDLDIGKGLSADIADAATATATVSLDPIVVEVTGDGVTSATVSIPLTTDLGMLPLAVAAREGAGSAM